MMGRRESRFDLRRLRGTPRLFGIGPIEGLTGEVTIIDGRPSLSRVGADGSVKVSQSFDAGVPFLVWAKVTGQWQPQLMPIDVRDYSDLERFVGAAAERAGLTGAFPFTVTGRPARIGYHIVNAPLGSRHPTGAEAHKGIQAHFGLEGEPATLVGFYSREHHGVFTPMNSNMHVHMQTADNTRSGHVEAVDFSPGGFVLSIPSAPM